MRAFNLLLCCALLGAVWSSEAADVLATKADGWHTWQVDESGASSEMCCYSWDSGKRTRGSCNLDGRNMSFSNDGDCSAAPGTLQVYAQIRNGQPESIHVLSSNCSVATKTSIVNHGTVTSEENMSWFRGVIEDPSMDQDAREMALFALVLSASDAAYDYIDRLLSQN